MLLRFKKDHFITGFIPGLIAPVVGSYIYYLISFHYMGLSGFYHHIVNNNLWISVLSIGVILNLGLFYGFYHFGIDRSAKGVLGATFIYSFIAIYYKVII